MTREIIRGIVSILLLVLAGFLIYLGITSPEPAMALGIGVLAGSIVTGVVGYWLKP